LHSHHRLLLFEMNLGLFLCPILRFSGGSRGLEELRLSLAKQGPLAGALRAALALVDASVAAQLLPKLLGLLRRGVGLATRATAAAVVDSLCLTVRRAPGRLSASRLFESTSWRHDAKVPDALRARLPALRGEVPARKLLFLLGDLALSERSPTVRKAFQVKVTACNFSCMHI
jgi:hypothetical protein